MVRIKERYLLVNLIYPPDISNPAPINLPSHVVLHQPTTDNLTGQSLLKAIKAEISTLFGEYGAGIFDSTLWIKYLSLATSTFIIRCPRAHYRMLWAALTFMDHVPTRDGHGRPCIFRVVRVSGTMRKAEEEAIRQARRLIIAANEGQRGKEGGIAKDLSSSTTPNPEIISNIKDVFALDSDDDPSDDEPMRDDYDA